MTDLQTLANIDEINQTLSRLTRILDKRNWTDLHKVFAEDLTFDYGRGDRAGLEQMRVQLSEFLDNCGPTVHLAGSALIDVDGDTALSEVYVLARHQGAGERCNLFFDAAGSWIDRWERRKNGWRIVRREIALSVVQGDPMALGTDALPAGIPN
ncbi:nuclear transport factor 2 family protein [Mycobacterium syngnathidarum]